MEEESGRKPIDRKKLRILLFSLAGALAVAAAILFVVLWSEGVNAGKQAQAVLAASGITPDTTAAGTEGATDTEGAPSGQPSDAPVPTLPPELEGYKVIARLDIDKIEAHLPVLAETSKAALKVSVCYYEGAMPGEDGNIVITGHNYANGSHFGYLDRLEVGDSVLLTSADGTTQEYVVYAFDRINPDQPEKLNDTTYERELTMFTCMSSGNARLVVRCRPAS